MKKMYNLSAIMKRAWELKKQNKKNIFALCLKMAWAEAKTEKKAVKFVNGMDVCADGYTRELRRWTKGGYDRVYINGGSRKGDGFVDLKTKRAFVGKLTYQKKIAEMILAMDFD